jgi:Cu/Ag efflux protein CusF
MVVRGEMKGKSEYITKPVKMAFEKQAVQYALQKKILDKAKMNAEKYYNELMGGIYDEVDISFDDSRENNLSQMKLPLIPLNLTVSEENFGYELHKSEAMGPVVATFKKSNSKITIGYSQKSKKSYADLWKGLRSKSPDKVFLKFIDPVSPIHNGVVCEYGKSSDAVCYVQKGNNLFYLHHVPTNDELAKMTLADILYASFNTSSCEVDSEAQHYFKFVDLIKDAQRELDNERFANLKMIAEKILKLQPENEYGRLLLSIAESINQKYTACSGRFQKIDLRLRLYDLIRNDSYNKLNRSMRRDVFSSYDESINSRFLNNLRSCLFLEKDRVGLSEQEAETYLKSIVEAGHLTDEIVKNISPEQFLQSLRIRLKAINSLIQENYQEDNKFEKNVLYCPANANNTGWNIRCDRNDYYDSEAFDEKFKKGNDSAFRQLRHVFKSRGIRINLDKALIAIVTRGIFFVDYDAFILKQNGLLVVRDLWDDLEKVALFVSNYENLNLGNDSFTFRDKEYKNKALLKLLKDLHKIAMDAEKGTKKQMLTDLKDQIRNLVREAIHVHIPG